MATFGATGNHHVSGLLTGSSVSVHSVLDPIATASIFVMRGGGISSSAASCSSSLSSWMGPLSYPTAQSSSSAPPSLHPHAVEVCKRLLSSSPLSTTRMTTTTTAMTGLGTDHRHLSSLIGRVSSVAEGRAAMTSALMTRKGMTTSTVAAASYAGIRRGVKNTHSICREPIPFGLRSGLSMIRSRRTTAMEMIDHERRRSSSISAAVSSSSSSSSSSSAMDYDGSLCSLLIEDEGEDAAIAASFGPPIDSISAGGFLGKSSKRRGERFVCSADMASRVAERAVGGNATVSREAEEMTISSFGSSPPPPSSSSSSASSFSPLSCTSSETVDGAEDPPNAVGDMASLSEQRPATAVELGARMAAAVESALPEAAPAEEEDAPVLKLSPLEERKRRRASQQSTYQFAAVASTVGFTTLAAAAVYYRFVFQLQGTSIPFNEVASIFALAIGAAVGMEYWARWAHKSLWHASLWSMHESHHKPRDGPFEANDIFAIINAVPAISLISYGFFHKGLVPGLCFGAGLGITLFGIAYMFVHDGLVHKRFPVGPVADLPYLQRVAAAHQLHHADKFEGVPYGLFLGPEELRQVGGLQDMEDLLKARRIEIAQRKEER